MFPRELLAPEALVPSLLGAGADPGKTLPHRPLWGMAGTGGVPAPAPVSWHIRAGRCSVGLLGHPQRSRPSPADRCFLCLPTQLGTLSHLHGYVLLPLHLTGAPLPSLVAQQVKNPPAKQETRVQSLGWEDPLEKGMATHSSILVWRIPWMEEPGGLQSVGSQRVRNTTQRPTLSLSPPFRAIFTAADPFLSPGHNGNLIFSISPSLWSCEGTT